MFYDLYSLLTLSAGALADDCTRLDDLGLKDDPLLHVAYFLPVSWLDVLDLCFITFPKPSTSPPVIVHKSLAWIYLCPLLA